MLIPTVDCVIAHGGGLYPDTEYANDLSIRRIFSLQDYWRNTHTKPLIVFCGCKFNMNTQLGYKKASSEIYRDMFIDPVIGIEPNMDTIFDTKQGFDTLTEMLSAAQIVRQLTDLHTIMLNTSGDHFTRTLAIARKVFGQGYEFFENPYSFPDSSQMNQKREQLHMELFDKTFKHILDGQIPYTNDLDFYNTYQDFYRETQSIIESTRSKEGSGDEAYMRR